MQSGPQAPGEQAATAGAGSAQPPQAVPSQAAVNTALSGGAPRAVDLVSHKLGMSNLYASFFVKAVCKMTFDDLLASNEDDGDTPQL